MSIKEGVTGDTFLSTAMSSCSFLSHDAAQRLLYYGAFKGDPGVIGFNVAWFRSTLNTTQSIPLACASLSSVFQLLRRSTQVHCGIMSGVPGKMTNFTKLVKKINKKITFHIGVTVLSKDRRLLFLPSSVLCESEQVPQVLH